MSTLPPIRTLFVTMMVYPPRGGTHLRNWQNINIMKKFGSVGVFSVFNRDNRDIRIDEIDFWQHCNIDQQPNPQVLLERGIRLLRRKGFRYYWSYLSTAAQALDKALKTFQPDLIIFEELGIYPYLSVVQRYGCPIIFDDHNVETALYRDINCSDQSLTSWFKKEMYLPQIQNAEADFVRQANQFWVCSEQDKQSLRGLYEPTSPCYVVPNSIDVAYYNSRYFDDSLAEAIVKSSQKDLLFLGSFLHPPNAEAAQLLIEQIFPKLKQLVPDCRLLLVGSKPTQAMQEAARQDSNIIVTGEVADVRPYLTSSSLMIVPLKKGSGTRFKILEAFASRLPVISTTKGAEGLDAKDGEHLLIRDTADAIADAVIQLWSNTSLGQKLSDCAYEFVKTKYSWEAASRRVEAAIQDLFEKDKNIFDPEF